MKRDMDLVRKILIQMEDWPARPVDRELVVPGYTEEEIEFHVGMMAKAGLLEAYDASSHDGEAWIPQAITWQGQDFLKAARSETVWNKAKELAKKNAGALSIEAMKLVLEVLVKKASAGG
jgi:hypothetical protein